MIDFATDTSWKRHHALVSTTTRATPDDFHDWRMSPCAPDVANVTTTIPPAQYDPLRDQGEACGRRLGEARCPAQIFEPTVCSPGTSACKFHRRRKAVGHRAWALHTRSGRPDVPLDPQAERICALMSATRVEMAPEDRVQMARRLGPLPPDDGRNPGTDPHWGS
jgi:hypothetical protein